MEAWRQVELGAPLGGGSRNPVYRASRGTSELVVRVSARSEASLTWELDLLDFLAAQGVTVPVALETDDGRRHDNGVVVHKFIRGTAPRDRSDWQRAAATIGMVHDITRGWPQRPGFASAQTLLCSTQGGDVDFSTMPAPAAKLVRDTWRPLLDGDECVVHGDFGAGNMLVTDDAVALIDWDESRVDVPAFDFTNLPAGVDIPAGFGGRQALLRAGIAWETATCWNVEPDYAQRCLAKLYQLTA